MQLILNYYCALVLQYKYSHSLLTIHRHNSLQCLLIFLSNILNTWIKYMDTAVKPLRKSRQYVKSPILTIILLLIYLQYQLQNIKNSTNQINLNYHNITSNHFEICTVLFYICCVHLHYTAFYYPVNKWVVIFPVTRRNVFTAGTSIISTVRLHDWPNAAIHFFSLCPVGIPVWGHFCAPYGSGPVWNALIDVWLRASVPPLA